jgi:hypothetical protein
MDDFFFQSDTLLGSRIRDAAFFAEVTDLSPFIGRRMGKEENTRPGLCLNVVLCPNLVFSVS